MASLLSNFSVNKWSFNKLALLVFLLSFLLRLTAVSRYITPDELIWVYRSIQFREALLSGEWLGTLTAGHPGVITTWLGAAAISLQMILHPASTDVYTWLTQLVWFAPENMQALRQLSMFLSAGRVAVALVNSVGLTAVFLLTRKLFNNTVAVSAALLLAFDPFLAGLSGLLHVDALLTTFATLSLLSLLVGLLVDLPNRKRVGYTAVSGTMAALALLTKSPAILLPPLTASFMLIIWWRRYRSVEGMRWLLWQGAAWLTAFCLVLFLLFPALWLSPIQVLDLMNNNASRHIAEALRPTFFLGKVDFDHGPIFYPIALAFRLSPTVFSGIFLSFWLIIRNRRGSQNRRSSDLSQYDGWVIGLLLVWTTLFIVGISIATKKFDRYVLPVFPAMTLFATIIWSRMLVRKWRGIQFGVLIPVALQVVYLLFYLLYPLSAYNWLVGGPAVAESVMPIGWGEGVSAAGRWLADQPEYMGKTAVSPTAPSFAPFYPNTFLFEADTWGQADILVVSAGSRQGNEAQFDARTENAKLLYTIQYGGLEQAWVYERPFPDQPISPEPLSEPVVYDNQVQLLGAAAEVGEEQVRIVAVWDLLQGGENGRYTVKFTLSDECDQIWTSMETPLLNDTYFYPEHWQTDKTPLVNYRLSLPLALPPATYQLDVELINTESGAQLPVLTENGRFAGISYQVAELKLEPLESVISASRVAIDNSIDAIWDTAGLRLLGYDSLWESVVTGTDLPIDLYWQLSEPTETDWQVGLQIGDVVVKRPLSRWPVQSWRAGELVHEKYLLPVPVDLAEGVYPVLVMLLDENGDRVGETAVLGTISVNPLERLFTLPNDIETSLNYQFGDDVQLLGVDATTQASVGEDVAVTLTWQVLQQPPVLYNAFVHLVGPDGQIVAQDDRWPGGLPTDLWVAGQVIVDEYVIVLPEDAPAGEYQVVVGMYTADSGIRFPITDSDGANIQADQISLPFSIDVNE
ncbi:MAG: hypothetical protein DWQ04_27430 [Chloroflexi bacterium]|nr:MAG: hypothetical protein DWQ04_27430 [Chloroflexota bacterium]